MMIEADWPEFSEHLAKMFMGYPSMYGRVERPLVQSYWDVLRPFDFEIVSKAIAEARRQGVNKEFAPSAASIEQIAEPLQRTRKVTQQTRELPKLTGKTMPANHTCARALYYEAEMEMIVRQAAAKNGGYTTHEDGDRFISILQEMAAGTYVGSKK